MPTSTSVDSTTNSSDVLSRQPNIDAISRPLSNPKSTYRAPSSAPIDQSVHVPVVTVSNSSVDTSSQPVVTAQNEGVGDSTVSTTNASSNDPITSSDSANVSVTYDKFSGRSGFGYRGRGRGVGRHGNARGSSGRAGRFGGRVAGNKVWVREIDPIHTQDQKV